MGASALILLVQARLAFAPAERRRWTTWIAAFALVPPLAIGIVSRLLGFGYNVRHSTWAAVAVWVMLAQGEAHGRPRRLAFSMAALLGVGLAIANYNRVFSDAHRNEDVRAAAAFLESQNGKQPTFVISGYMSKPLSRYLPADWPVKAIDADSPKDDVAQVARSAVRADVSPGERFWLVYTREFHGDPQGAALHAMQEEFDLKREHEFAGIVVYGGICP